MAPVPFLIAFAVAGGQVTFAGAVATPTVAEVSAVTPVSSPSAAPSGVQVGRFDSPPRVVSIRTPGNGDNRSEVVVTYL